MAVTKNLARYVDAMGINLADLARKAGISYPALYKSIGIKEASRELRADELTSICSVLGKNPMDFYDGKEG